MIKAIIVIKHELWYDACLYHVIELVDLISCLHFFVTGQNGFLFMVNDSTIKNLFSLGFKMMIYLILERHRTY